MASGCPFAGRAASGSAGSKPLQEANRAPGAGGKLPTGRARVSLLYEEYVHLPLLRQVWLNPSTERPVLEPLFAAAFHGIELGFLLLSEFISDGRGYVAKRPRVEAVAEDIATQCQLLTEVIDAELEDELAEGEGGGASPASRLSLTQPFPFEGCPPTKAEPCHSPGLSRLTRAIESKLPGMSAAERNSVIKLVINLTAAFSAFQRWTVGLGVEPQLQALQAAVGLAPTEYPHRLNLDYDSLVQPWLCEQTLTCETYTYAEDFFFRTIHLGTDCWAFLALSRLASCRQLAEAGRWDAAAARATQAARILDYMGSHILLLTSMNLRDYLLLKVELEGTSGEGSVQVKSLRPTVASLFAPLEAALLGPPSSSSSSLEGEAREAALRQAVMGLYEFPDRRPGLYSYCKALEGAETGLLGGFYYKHYLLATNVIGTEAKGTMKRAVAALKAGYETLVFPLLDGCRVALGARLDAELAERKGGMMQAILRRVQERGAQGQQAAAAGAPPLRPPAGTPPPAKEGQGKPQAGGGGVRAVLRCDSALGTASPVKPAAGCPFAGSGSASPASAAEVEEGVVDSAAGREASVAAAFEEARQRLYSWEGVPPGWHDEVAAELAQQAQQLGLVSHPSSGAEGKPLAFLDHAWGQLAPRAQYLAWREAAALYQLGNPAWDAAFGRVLPQAAASIKRLLGLPASDAACTVHFGSNSHELVTRLLSACLGRRSNGSSGLQQEGGSEGGSEDGSSKWPLLRVLTSDTEFYSFTRQLNRLAEAGLAEAQSVPAEPAATFTERCCAAVAAASAAGRPFDAVYISQITYLTQQTIVPDIPALVRGIRAAAAAGTASGMASAASAAPGAAASPGNGGERGGSAWPAAAASLIIVDGYHGFCALPTDLGEVAGEVVYVAGLLKHAGCGANCAFLTLPASLAAAVRPVLTGWLADPSVLAPGSQGVRLGSEVGYLPQLVLQGSTPAYLLPLLTFNHLMQLWEGAAPAPITVDALHGHVLGLQDRFLAGLSAAGHAAISGSSLLGPQDPTCRSHTLVFRLPDPSAAAQAVAALAAQGVLLDTRQGHVRVGFGPNHSPADVDALLAALKDTAASAAI